MKLINILLTLSFSLLLQVSFQLHAKSEGVDVVTIAAPVSAPFVYKNKEGKAEGFLVAFFTLVEQKLGLKTSISIMPWARAMHEVKIGRINALMPTLYTDERAQYLTYPNLPLMEFQTVLLKRTQDEIVVDNITTLGAEKVIVKIRAMSMGKAFDDAEKSGKIKVIEVLNFDDAIQMLVQSRADLVACIYNISHSSIKRLNLQDKVEILKFSNEKTLSYLSFSNEFNMKNNVNELMEKINKVKTTPEYQALVDKFLK
jgi:polar amino acid transport system substrate-binding protein